MQNEPRSRSDAGIVRVEQLLRGLGAGDGEFLHQVIGDLLFAAPDMFRPTTALLVAEALGAEGDERVVRFAAAVQIVYAAMHTHQQVRLAREPAAGNLVVLAGDYLYAQAAVIAAGLDHLPVMALLSEAIKEICRQGLEEPQGVIAGATPINDASVGAVHPDRRVGAVGLFELSTAGAALLAGAPAAAIAAAGRYGSALDALTSTRTPEAARQSISHDAVEALGPLPAGMAREELGRLSTMVSVPAWLAETLHGG